MSAFTWAVVPALEKRYIICVTSAGTPARAARRSQRASPSRRRCRVIDVARPTTVRCGDPGTPVTVICVPRATDGPQLVGQHDLPWLRRPVARGEREVVDRAARRGAADDVSSRDSAGSAGDRRCHGEASPGPRSPGTVRPPPSPRAAGWWRPAGRTRPCSSRSPARRAARRTRDRTARSSRRAGRAPACEAAVETSTTRPITIACTRRPDSPPRAARTPGRAGIALIAAPL